MSPSSKLPKSGFCSVFLRIFPHTSSIPSSAAPIDSLSPVWLLLLERWSFVHWGVSRASLAPSASPPPSSFLLPPPSPPPPSNHHPGQSRARPDPRQTLPANPSPGAFQTTVSCGSESSALHLAALHLASAATSASAAHVKMVVPSDSYLVVGRGGEVVVFHGGTYAGSKMHPGFHSGGGRLTTWT